MRLIFLLLPAAVSACASTRTDSPPLAPRAAEAIDPRVPIPTEPVAGPADRALQEELGRLLEQVRSGSSEFDRLASEADRLVSLSGPPESESWVTAQQAISALIAARAPVTMALADIDALGTSRISSTGGLTAGDRIAIERAAEIAGVMSRQQAQTIDRLQARLAS